MQRRQPLTVPLSVEWILRIGVAMEYLGHGMLGFGRPLPWAAYFGVAGIGHDPAYALMPWVALMDVSMAVLALVVPIRAAVFYMAAWGLWTALLRPLSGESSWEAVERAGNYGAPWALFLIMNESRMGAWMRGTVARFRDGRMHAETCWVLRLTTVALLLGHGALGLLLHKPLLASHYAALGLHSPSVEAWIGGFEILLALAVLFKPAFWLLAFVFAWKVATELLSPLAGLPFWVFIEHGGSYAAPLALALLQEARTAKQEAPEIDARSCVELAEAPGARGPS